MEERDEPFRQEGDRRVTLPRPGTTNCRRRRRSRDSGVSRQGWWPDLADLLAAHPAPRDLPDLRSTRPPSHGVPGGSTASRSPRGQGEEDRRLPHRVPTVLPELRPTAA